MHIPVYCDITIISNTNIEFPIPPNITIHVYRINVYLLHYSGPMYPYTFILYCTPTLFRSYMYMNALVTPNHFVPLHIAYVCRCKFSAPLHYFIPIYSNIGMKCVDVWNKFSASLHYFIPVYLNIGIKIVSLNYFVSLRMCM